MLRWLVRLPAVVLIAAIMGWLGLILMFLGTPYTPGIHDFWTQYVVIASILLWTILTAALKRQPRDIWIVWGLCSPLLGCLIVAPPASFAFLIAKAYIAFPVGLATSLLLWGVFQLGSRSSPTANKKQPASLLQ